MTEGGSSVLPIMYMHESNAIHIQRSSRAGAERTFRLEMIKQNEI
jgi:hypothetical protein